MLIPTKRELVLDLALHGKSGLNALGTTLGVAQNTAARMTTDIENYVGEAGSLTNIGALGQYNKQQGLLKDARAARTAARNHARSLCADAIDLLRKYLGRRWNPAWLVAGFGGSTLAVTNATVTSKLHELRNYFRDNPAREVASEGITAAAFDAEIAAYHAAEQARDAAISNLRDAADARDAAAKQLRKRLSGLQEELSKLLSPSDNRWADFGFPRPIDGSMPERVEDLILTAGLPGTVRVQWGHSPRAINFRVSWRVQNASGDPTVAGLYGDGEATLSGLPSGATIEVLVTARNNAGETQPTIAAIIVP